MPWCLPFRTSLGSYVYDTTMNSVLTVSSDLYGVLANAASGESWSSALARAPENAKKEYLGLCEAGYLHENPLEKIEHPLTRSVALRLERQVGMLILQVTQRCNFRCKYCIYSESNDLNRCHSSEDMSFETACEAIDFYYRHSVDCSEVSISFYGGEPLLRLDLIKRVVEYSESLFRGREVLFRLTTNASLLNEEAVRFFTREGHKFSVLISLDGPQEIQDKERVFPDGSGTYSCIMKNLHCIPDICENYASIFSFNSVLDTDNSYESIIRMSEDPFVSNCSVQFNFVEKEDRKSDYNPDFLEQVNYDMFLGYVSYFRDAEPTYPNKLIEYLIKRNRLQEERLAPGSMGEVSAPSGPCIPGGHRLFVDCSGKFYPCERVSEANRCMKIGDLRGGFDYDAVESMLNVAKSTQNECSHCWAFQLCSLCIKSSDEGGKITDRARLELCEQVRLNAMDLLGRLALNAENIKHVSHMGGYFASKK